MNKIEAAFARIIDKKYCIGMDGMGHCGTCGCMDAYKELELIGDITEEFLKTDINKLGEIDLNSDNKHRKVVLHSGLILFLFNRFDFDKEKVLAYWLDTLDDEQIKFFDYILFYVVRRMKKCEIREKWINKCIVLAEKTSNFSLQESLFYTEHLGDGWMFEDKDLYNKG